MPPFRFIQAHFPDPAHSRAQITERLLAHRRKLRAARQQQTAALKEAGGGKNDPDWLNRKDRLRLNPEESRKIERRATKINDRCSQGSGLSHLKPHDLKKLETLRGGVRLAGVATEHQADELAPALHTEYPWMGPATEIVWHGMRRAAREGGLGLQLPPLLLDGPPGIGKSAWARSLGDLIKVPTMVYEATVQNASFGLVGAQRNWGNSNPGRFLNTIMTTRVGNLVLVIDEVEKSGRAESNKGQALSLTEALLPLLEPLSTVNWSCPYFEVKFDMSYVIWVMTSNNAANMPELLLSRCPPIRLQRITSAELIGFARREGHRKALDEVSIEAIVETIERHCQSAVSLRAVMRMIQHALQLQAPGARLH